MSVSFSGELAYEIHVSNASPYAAYTALREAGQKFGMILFGARAIESMRMEKGFLHCKADILSEFNPIEANLGHFVQWNKSTLIGKDALVKQAKNKPRKTLVTLSIDIRGYTAQG